LEFCDTAVTSGALD